MSENYKGLYLKSAEDVMILKEQIAQQTESKPSIEDVQSLVKASEVIMKWCAKNVQGWTFSEYNCLHSATKKVELSLPPAPKGGE